jgi:hypothetical protein
LTANPEAHRPIPVTQNREPNVPDIFIDDVRYNALVKVLASIKAGLFVGGKEDQIKIALGEAGDIWPVSIRDDAIRVAVEDREQHLCSRNAG